MKVELWIILYNHTIFEMEIVEIIQTLKFMMIAKIINKKPEI